VFIIGGAVAGLAGYHYFAAVPGVYKISRDYGYFGDLAFYGIICGLISLGNPLAAIPVALLFGGLSIGGRFVQGKLHLGFGVDYALLGVLMITLVAFQFFYRYRLTLTKATAEAASQALPAVGEGLPGLTTSTSQPTGQKTGQPTHSNPSAINEGDQGPA
jgi:simple sugar transport system permease protein